MNQEVEMRVAAFSGMEDNFLGDGMISGNVNIVDGQCIGVVTTSNQPSSEPVSPVGVQPSPQSSSVASPVSPGMSATLSPPQPETDQNVSAHQITLDQGPSIVIADSNSTRQVFVPCKVCGDKASGYHYGVTSCEGCKGFFRRSIQKQIEYRCLRDGKCMVMRLNRNRCQYCRFKKCLAVGMSRDSVRYGRVPKRSKSQDDPSVSTTERLQDQAELEQQQLAMYDIILTVSQAHHANCSTTDDKIKVIIRKTSTLISKLDVGAAALATEQMLEAHRCQMFQNLAAHILPTIQQVVEFAKRIPGFPDFSQDDQLILIKSSFYEIWLTRMAKLFNCNDNSLTLEDGSIIPKGELDIVYTPNIVSNMFSFAQGFCELKLNDTEVGLFTACLLINTNRPNVNMNTVEKLQDKLMEAMRLQIARNHVSKPTLFSSLEGKMKDLRHIGQQHSQLLAWFRQRWQVIKTPPLFAEIYDIRKVEDD